MALNGQGNHSSLGRKLRKEEEPVLVPLLWNVVSATSLLSSSYKWKICPDEDKPFGFLSESLQIKVRSKGGLSDTLRRPPH